MAYELTVPCVIADTPAGKLYVYHPALLPEDTNPEQIASLLADKLIKDSEGHVSVAYDEPEPSAPKSTGGKATA